jgi:hypothetical protein
MQIKKVFCLIGLIALTSVSVWSQATYSTNFPLTENPINESGKWISGTTGLDWTNCRTTPGFAFGTMPGNAGGNARYADSIAVLTGAWGQSQTAQATLYVPNPVTSFGIFEEVELHVLTTIAPHSIVGYEANLSVNTADGYVQIGRWGGPLNQGNVLGNSRACAPGKTGDVFKLVFTPPDYLAVYVNNNLVVDWHDPSPLTTGNPGLGFFLQGVKRFFERGLAAADVNANYGFSSFSATDQQPPKTHR